MAKTILIAGYGPGISSSVAEKFGAEGFQVALVGRTREKLDAGVKALTAKGVKAAAFTADLGDPAAIEKMVAAVRAELGPISVLEWTAFTPGSFAGDVLTAKLEDVRQLFDISVVGLLAAVRAALPDLQREKGALLVTNGAAGFIDPQVDEMMVKYGMMGLGLGNAAKQKLVGMLAKKLAPDVFVTEVMIAGAVKGTPFDTGAMPTIDPAKVAQKYWDLFQGRSELRTTIRG